MNENKRLILVGAVIALIVAIIMAITFWPKADNSFVCGIKSQGDYSKLGVVNYKQYQCLIKEDKKNALVISNNLTKKKKEVLDKVAKSIGHSIYYLDVNSIDNSNMKKIKKALKYDDKSFTKDVILVINKGKVEAYKEKVLTNDEELSKFLKDSKLAKFACDVQPSEEYENLGAITYEQYNCLYESDEAFAVILSQTTCGYCKQFKPFINEYVGNKNIPLYVIEVNTLAEDEKNALLSSLSYFDDNDSWGTPLTLGIKNKEVIANLSGYTDDEDQVSKFFKEVGLMK